MYAVKKVTHGRIFVLAAAQQPLPTLRIENDGDGWLATKENQQLRSCCSSHK